MLTTFFEYPHLYTQTTVLNFTWTATCWIMISLALLPWLPGLMVNVWVAWKGCGRCSVRLDRRIAPSIFLPILRALFRFAFQNLEHVVIQRSASGHPHSLWHCIAHCMTRHDVTSMQINNNRGSLKADWVISSACYLYPRHFSGWVQGNSSYQSQCSFVPGSCHISLLPFY